MISTTAGSRVGQTECGRGWSEENVSVYSTMYLLLQLVYQDERKGCNVYIFVCSWSMKHIGTKKGKVS